MWQMTQKMTMVRLEEILKNKNALYIFIFYKLLASRKKKKQMTFTIIADEKNPSFLFQIFHMSPKIHFMFHIF
jgi:hypothetical protein